MITKLKINAQDWKQWITPGCRVFVGSGAACPNALMSELMKHTEHFVDVELIHILTLGEAPWITEENCNKFRINSLFLDAKSRHMVSKGISDYTPCFLSEIPRLFMDKTLPIDVAIISVSPPDKYGYCSMGVSVDVVSAAAHSARYVVAQFNPNMPRTHGRSFIHVDKITAMVEIDVPLPEIESPHLDDITLTIGKYVSTLVEDGATLQMGIGKIPNAVLANLTDRNDLGIHTEMFSDGVLDLFEKGVITNAKKSLHPHKTITSFCMGSRYLYEYVNNNPHIEFHPSEYVNSPLVIAQNSKMVAINSAIEVDLTGQVVSDQVGYRFYSGIGGQVDFIRGAAQCPTGIPIIALPSTCKNFTISKLVPFVTSGAGVVTSRGYIHYVVTEYGIATLRGRSIRERALELIQIAHPKFRDQLLAEVRKHFWVPSYQQKKPLPVSELGNIELVKLNLKGDPYILRTLRPADERKLQEFFYSHDNETIYQRYRSVVKSMSRESAYELVNVDQSQDLALCILIRQGPREIIQAVGRYYFEKVANRAEVALIVQENQRNKGLATSLLEHMIKVAQARKIEQIFAYVRPDNLKMIRVFSKLGFEKIKSDEEGEQYYALNLIEFLQT